MCVPLRILGKLCHHNFDSQPPRWCAGIPSTQHSQPVYPLPHGTWVGLCDQEHMTEVMAHHFQD